MRERPGDRTGSGHPDTSAVALSPPRELVARAARFACGLARDGVPADVLARAKAIHARAQDDTHYPSQTHPGAAVIPAALALTERCGASGGMF